MIFQCTEMAINPGPNPPSSDHLGFGVNHWMAIRGSIQGGSRLVQNLLHLGLLKNLIFLIVFFQKKKSVIQIITGSFSQGNSSGGFVPIQIAGWWFGTFGLFFHILGIIIYNNPN